jgi:biotin carboxylase
VFRELSSSEASDLRGRRLLVVLGSYKSKRHVYERAHALGVEITVLDGTRHWSRDHVGEEDLFASHLPVDVSPFPTFVERSVAAIESGGSRFDGIGTIEEFAGGFAARIAERLGLPFHSIEAADAARDKHRARELCAAAGIPGPRFARIETSDDLDKAARTVGFPAVLKPVSGVGSVQTHKVRDAVELRRRFDAVNDQVRSNGASSPAPSDSDRDWFDLMWSGEPAFVLESWIEGRKYDVDILLEGGRLAYGRATDDLEPCGLRDVRRIAPAGLDTDEERELVEHAASCVRALGFGDGAFNVEVKRTVDGPRTIEINGRLGGYSTVDIHHAVWGVDLVAHWLRSCFRLPLRIDAKAASCFVAESLLPSPRTGVVARDGFLDEAKTRPEVVAARPWTFSGDFAAGVETGAPDWLGAVLTKAPTRDEALRALDDVTASIDLPVRPA